MQYSRRSRWKKIGQRIQWYRKEAGLTQVEFAERVGLAHRSDVSKIERGERHVTALELAAIVRKLDIEMDRLVDNEDGGILSAYAAPESKWEVIGCNIRYYRSEKGWDQAELARQVKAKPPLKIYDISRVENGIASQKVRHSLGAIAQALEVSVERLREKEELPVKENTSVGEKLALTRQRLGFSQTLIANKTGIAIQRFGNIEAGRTPPTSDEVDSILKVLGITREELSKVRGVPLKKRNGGLVQVGDRIDGTTNLNSFAEQIRNARVAQGLNQYQLSQKSGVSQNYICEIERGYKSNLSWDIRERLVKALGLDKESSPMPMGLDDYAISDDLTEAEVSMLKGVHYLGSQPDTVDGWRFLYKAIKLAIVK